MTPGKKAVGARLRAERESAPYWSRPDLARLLRRAADPRERERLPHVKPLAEMIKHWEVGKSTPSPRYRALYCRVTGRSEQELFGDLAPARAAVPAPPPAVAGARGDYAAQVRDTNHQIIALDSRFGGSRVADLAVQAFTTAQTALATGRHDAGARDLQSAAGEAGEIAAWTLYDAFRLEESRTVTHEAMLLSRLAGDRGMELFQLSHLALLDVHVRRPQEALQIAEHTIDGAVLAPRVEALFKLRAARALAQGGDRARALAVLDAAGGALQESLHPRDPEWTWWLDSSEMHWHRGMLHLELGDPKAAVPHLGQAAQGRIARGTYAPPDGAGPDAGTVDAAPAGGRAAYNDLAHLLLVLTMAQAWREAEEAAAAVIALSREVASARTEAVLWPAVRNVLRARHGAGGPSSTLVDAAEHVCAARGWSVGRG